MASYNWLLKQNESNHLIIQRADASTHTNPKTILQVDSDTGTTHINNHDISGTATLRLTNTSGNWVELGCGSTASNLELTLPVSNGSNNQVLTTNGAGVLSFTHPAQTFRLRLGKFNSSTGGTIELRAINTVDTAQGYRLTRNATAKRLAFQCRTTVVSSSNTVSVELYKNGSATGETVTTSTITSPSDNVGANGDISDVSFSAGDRATIYVIVPGSITLTDLVATVEFETA